MPLPADKQEPFDACRESLLGKAPRASRDKRSGIHPLPWVGVLMLAGLVGLNWRTVSRYLPLAPTPSTAMSPAIAPSQTARRTIAERVEPASPAPTSSAPRPLTDCMAGGSMIDEAVLRCRFGDVPRPKAATEPAQGLVSDAYLARYKAGQTASPRTARAAPVEIEQWEINGWDGRGIYHASWEVSDNHIDYTSVCLNYRRGSIDYRECRKGARQWFKAQCRQASADDEPARQRYCAAASGFSPMG